MPLDATAVAETVFELVERYMQRSLDPLAVRLAALEAQPPGRDGRDGLPGRDGAAGLDGAPGIAGLDGLGFDDLEVEHDGERGFVFRFAREGREPKEWRYSVPAQIYRGVYAEGSPYTRGDTVTWGGSLYHCNEATSDKPGAGAKAWTLAAKRGSDGRDGKAGPRGERGPEGGRGRDLTRLAADGSKY